MLSHLTQCGENYLVNIELYDKVRMHGLLARSFKFPDGSVHTASCQEMAKFAET